MSPIESKLRYMAKQYTNGSVARGGAPSKHYLEDAADRIATLERELSEATIAKEILITRLQDVCDHYIKYHKKPDQSEPQGFILWLPKELERREELSKLKKELGI